MSDKPFVKIGTAGSLKVKNNNTGGTPLLEADKVHGRADISGNSYGVSGPEEKPAGKIFVSGFLKWIITISSGVAIAAICAWLGYN